MEDSSRMRLLPPLLTLLASSAIASLGLIVWAHRSIPAPWITDPTSFKVAAIISAAIFLPAAAGALLSVVALMQRLKAQAAESPVTD